MHLPNEGLMLGHDDGRQLGQEDGLVVGFIVGVIVGGMVGIHVGFVEGNNRGHPVKISVPMDVTLEGILAQTNLEQ